MRNIPNKYIQKDDYLELHIYSKKHGEFTVLIDKDDYIKVSNIHWGIEFDNRNWYVRNRHLNIKLHRLVTDCPNNLIVDHINHNTLDNRKENLKICTYSENNSNRPITVKYPHTTDEYGIGIWNITKNNKTYNYYRVQIKGYKPRTFKDMEKALMYRNYLLELKQNPEMEVK